MKKVLVIWLFFVANIALAVDAPQQNEHVEQEQVTVGQDSTNQQSGMEKEVGRAKQALETLKEGPPPISDLFSISKSLWSIIFILLGYVMIRLISRILEHLAERSTRYRMAIKSFIPVVKILGWIVLIFIVIAGILRPPASTLLAFSASIGFAVGFASQDILKNIFGGIMILFDRPFQSGDKIRVGEHYGEVVEIGLRSTRIVTPDDNLVSIPNSEIMNSSVANANAGEPNCQVGIEIYLPIETDTIRAKSLAIEAAQVSRYIYLNKPIGVVFSNVFHDRKSVLKMKIKAYVLDIRDEFRFSSEITEIVLRKLVEEGIISDEKI
jgi:small-conductance mechanosensitive channel